jgi:hypothetical protein
MSSLPTRTLALAAGIAFALAAAAPADAKQARHPHKTAATHRAKAATPNCRGANLFPCGPVYFSDHYLGDDPDPFIRSQLLRTYGHSASLF